MKSAALYIRVSTNMQEELSPDAQKRLLLDYAKKNNMVVSEEYIYVENGISGKKANKRPEFMRMISLAKQKPAPFDVILVWKYSRFARNQEESIVYKSLLRKQCKIDVISVSEPVLEGPFGSLIERIIEWMDEYYSIRLSGEVKRGMTEKALRGGYQARPPLGYKIVERGKPPVVVPEEAEIVRLIFRLYVDERRSFFDIARYLNKCGYKTSHGKNFEVRSIDYIIKNPTYCGMIRWNRTTNETNEIKDESEWIITEGHHEAIIDKETFDKAQEIFKATYKPKGARPSSTYRHWLSGLMKCPYCGRTMIAKKMHRADGTPYSYFVCYGVSKGKCICTNTVSSNMLEPLIKDALQMALESGDVTYKLIKKQSVELVDHTAILKEQLLKINQKEKRIKDAYRDGIDTLEEYKENKMILMKEREFLESQIAESVPKETPSAAEKESLMNNIRNVYEMISSDEFSNQQKNEALRSIIEKIVFDRKNDSLKLYYYLVEN